MVQKQIADQHAFHVHAGAEKQQKFCISCTCRCGEIVKTAAEQHI
jgi:hypothetical protein